MTKSKMRPLVFVFLISIYCIASLCAQQQPAAVAPGPDASTGDLQKATQNPVASLITVPIQNNSNFNSGPFDRTQDVLNIQPVIPVNISENWMLITISARTAAN